ncbi:MAG: hypothetical protein V7721_02280 [Porticoccaceae bacterium]
MKNSIFVSYPSPINETQVAFIEALLSYLDNRGFSPRTLGVTDYDMDAPLKAMRRLMLESNGVITVALKKTLTMVPIDDEESVDKGILYEERWYTSPFCHVEPAMGFQLGLPILILREKGVVEDGVLDKGVIGSYMPEFDVTKPHGEYFRSREWVDIIGKFEGYARSVAERKGTPPRLY